MDQTKPAGDESSHLGNDPFYRVGLEDLLGESRSSRDVREKLEFLAHHKDATVLIIGETGTGKDLVARILHRLSQAPGNPAVFDCSSLPETLVAAELFGAEKGSFTGAYQRKVGRAEEAGRGTLFLDEIIDFPLGLQATLLRLLESRRFRRLGGNEDLSFSARVIAAAREPLVNQVQEGKFREDLYYRLGVVQIFLAPLRERKEDIPALARMFLNQLCDRYNRPPLLFRNPDMDWMTTQPFKGNIRELRNLIERSVIFTPRESAFLKMQRGESIDPPSTMTHQSSESSGPPVSVALMEKKLIQDTLLFFRGNISRSAQSLGISRPAVLRRLKEWPELRDTVRKFKGE